MKNNKTLLVVATLLIIVSILPWPSTTSEAKADKDNSTNNSYNTNINVAKTYDNIKNSDFSKNYTNQTTYNNQTEYSDQRTYNNQRNFNGSKCYSVAAGPGLLGYTYPNQNTYANDRLLDRYIDMNEKDLTAVKTDLKKTLKKLDDITNQLRTLNAKITKIEKTLESRR